MGVSIARRIAYDVLLRVETGGAYASDLLHERLGKARGLVKREDAALATELTLGVLRWQRWLDFLLARQLRRPKHELEPEVRIALRIGAYQLQFLTRVPARAAVNESVELVKAAGKRSAAGLVNAVLRRPEMAAPRETLAGLVSAKLPSSDRLGILHSHPTWLVERWLARWGKEQTAALLEANNRPPRIACALHVETAEQREMVIAEWRAAGLHVEASIWLREAILVRGGNPSGTEAFRKGQVSIQDEASQMVPLLLDVKPAEKVLDLCAAPGGKTLALARAAGPAGRVIAADLHGHRLRETGERVQRTGMKNVFLAALDATQPLPFSVKFDRVLVDAPCSGTGTLARNPEIRWRLRSEDLSALVEKQQAILTQACGVLAPGGRLVYSTCSLEPEENEDVVCGVLGKQSDVQLVSGRAALAEHLRAAGDAEVLFHAQGFFRTRPAEHGMDGFFAAAVERKK